MRNLLKVIIVMYGLCGLPVVHAEEAVSEAPQSSVTAGKAVSGKEEKKDGFSLFWVVFLFSILFVISSATALNTLGKKPPSGSKGESPPTRKKTTRDERRFRL